MKNYTTPRTLADSQFVTGHSSIESPRRQSVYGYLLACGIGFALAWALVYGWAA